MTPTFAPSGQPKSPRPISKLRVFAVSFRAAASGVGSVRGSGFMGGREAQPRTPRTSRAQTQRRFDSASSWLSVCWCFVSAMLPRLPNDTAVHRRVREGAKRPMHPSDCNGIIVGQPRIKRNRVQGSPCSSPRPSLPSRTNSSARSSGSLAVAEIVTELLAEDPRRAAIRVGDGVRRKPCHRRRQSRPRPRRYLRRCLQTIRLEMIGDNSAELHLEVTAVALMGLGAKR